MKSASQPLNQYSFKKMKTKTENKKPKEVGDQKRKETHKAEETLHRGCSQPHRGGRSHSPVLQVRRQKLGEFS